MIKIYSTSLGCPKNRVDTEALLGSLSGLNPVENQADADCILINTCAFVTPAIQESVRHILEAAEDMAEFPAGKRPKLVVAGCLVGRFGEKNLAPELPEVDLWLDNREADSWAERLALLLGLSTQNPERLLSTPPSYAWLKISEGCDRRCSFCTIPAIRGPFRSLTPETLLRQSRAILEQGVKELILVAQDSTAWGKDLGKQDLRDLLDDLLHLPGLQRLRIMYMYPAGINNDLLSYLAASGPKFMPYFDVPLQHAHPDILKRMGRPFAADPRPVLERIRRHFPAAALRTSIITGFPGETEEQFKALHDFIAETRFQHLGVFAYQAEEGTRAANMAEQLPEELKEERRAILMDLQKGISAELLEAHLHNRLQILVDEASPEWPGLHLGRSWFQAPEVDGVTYISGPGVAPGALVEADIVETREYDLVALT